MLRDTYVSQPLFVVRCSGPERDTVSVSLGSLNTSVEGTKMRILLPKKLTGIRAQDVIEESFCERQTVDEVYL